MSINVAAYNPEAFNNLLLGAGAADQQLTAKGGRDIIYERLGPIFLKHGMDEKLGLGLLHRHFAMSPDERLVEINDVSTPWDNGTAEEIGGTIVPHSWLIRDDELVPLEFRFVHEGEVEGCLPSSNAAFFQELSSELRALGLEDLVGLRVHPGPDFDGMQELPIGRANINVHRSKLPHIGRGVETAWFFDHAYVEKGQGFICPLILFCL